MTNTPEQTESTETRSEGEFVRVRFAGGRFDSHTIPFDVLPDLAAYRDLIVEVAKHLYRQRNPDRQRVPKGFAESFQLGLSEVLRGNSATALGMRFDAPDEMETQPDLGFPLHFEFFEDARSLIDRVIAAANDNKPMPSDFPRETLGRFNRFGQSLKAGEHAELSHPSVQPVRYDNTTRKRIVLSANPTYEDSVDQKFVITGGNLQTNVVHVVDEQGNSFDFRVDSPEECDKAISRRRHQLRLVGTGQFDRQDHLSRITSYRELIFTDDEPHRPCDERLDEIARTPSGWYSEGNPAPNPNAIARMRKFVAMATGDAGVPAPYIYPLPEGGVTAEWTRSDWEISATVDAATLHIELHGLNTETDAEFESVIESFDDNALSTFGTFWKSMSEGDA
ncbi:MAG: hypothetical protein ACYCZD_08015 [Rhodanobacter sp.]